MVIWSDLSKLDQTWSNLFKLDQTWSNLIKLDQSSTFYKFLIINLLALDDNKMVICFRSDLSKLDQTWSNLIKFGFFTYQKMLLWKVVTFIVRIIMVNFFWLDQMKSVQNGSKWIKPDPIWISHSSKNDNLKDIHIYQENKHGQLFWIKWDLN